MRARLSKHSALNPERHPGLPDVKLLHLRGGPQGTVLGLVSFWLECVCVLFLPESIDERGGADRDGGSDCARPKLHDPELERHLRR